MARQVQASDDRDTPSQETRMQQDAARIVKVDFGGLPTQQDAPPTAKAA